ncbi:hypothetical protein [Clostridium tyrobutyricum]|uniref:hypothetical protein n=1 Tax=Clostridium tyrobutyricum TaxID=1519 RepID=UPI001C39116F|nr:hypothetical protein [Clostridium tyrobutyricum]MBV4424310.1 hypothetical protein [Clostridium tyrobutyricum]
MEDIKKYISKVNESTSETESFLKYGMLSLGYFNLDEYDKLIVKINQERETNSDINFRNSLIAKYKEVYQAKKNKLSKMCINLNKRKFKFFPILKNDEIKTYLEKFFHYDEEKSVGENLSYYAKIKIEQAIKNCNEELYLLKKHPNIYINSKDTYIGGDFGYRYENEIIIYKDVSIQTDGFHHFAIHSNELSLETTKRELLNIFAYINGRPIFQFTQNPRFNEKLDQLYNQFDLLDMLRLRNTNYFKEETKDATYLELPIVKNYKDYKVIIFKELQHGEALDLYHSSLKQFEPLPRCVFLYRVFEYASAKDYKVKFHPTNYQPEDAIEYYIQESIKYNPNPLYYVDFGDKQSKYKIVSYFSKLKTEANKIFYEWSNHPYLKTKTKGQIIYNRGRNLVAHGGNGSHNMRYDYANNYKHINDINIILELIARYVIENLNPELKNIVERRLVFYQERYKSS